MPPKTVVYARVQWGPGGHEYLPPSDQLVSVWPICGLEALACLLVPATGVEL